MYMCGHIFIHELCIYIYMYIYIYLHICTVYMYIYIHICIHDCRYLHPCRQCYPCSDDRFRIAVYKLLVVVVVIVVAVVAVAVSGGVRKWGHPAIQPLGYDTYPICSRCWNIYLQNEVIDGVDIGQYSIHGASGFLSADFFRL